MRCTFASVVAAKASVISASRELLSGTAGSGIYAYDDENRLTVMSNNAAGLKTTLAYDGLGRLRIRQEWGLSNAPPPAAPAGAAGAAGQSPQPQLPSPWSLTNEVHYVYDGKRVIQERDQYNAPTVSYTRGRDLSGSLEGAGGIGGLLARSAGYSAGRWTSHAYYHADGNGNVTFLLASNQTLAASYRYDPYANRVASSGPLADANLYRFSSKEFHANSGLYYYLYRWYDPTTQRWMNRDPIAELGGINLYRFVGNEPVQHVDPLGADSTNFPLPITIGPQSGVPPRPTLPQDIEQQWLLMPYSPTSAASLDANCTRGGTVNTGNGLPTSPVQTFPLCSEDERNVSQVAGKSQETCPGGKVVTCTDYTRCEKALDGKLRWLPHKTCPKCPDGTRIQR